MDDEVSEAIETVVKESKGLLPVAVGLLVFGAGVGLGYILGRRSKPPEIFTLPPRDTRPPKVVVDEVPEKPKMSMQEIKQTLEEDPNVEVVLLNEKKVEANNVFAASTTDTDVWDIDEEIKRRSPNHPYPIHQEEFFAEEMESEDYIQTQLTYYAGDDVLVDAEEAIIYNRSEVVGDAMVFGHGSGDPNCVYIRNMERRMEYEVIRDLGHYRVEVQGLEQEQEERAKDIRHSKTPRKFRSD